MELQLHPIMSVLHSILILISYCNTTFLKLLLFHGVWVDINFVAMVTLILSMLSVHITKLPVNVRCCNVVRIFLNHIVLHFSHTMLQAVDDSHSNVKDLRAGLIPSATLRERSIPHWTIINMWIVILCRLEYQRLHKQLLFNKQRKPFSMFSLDLNV